jgi:hypothetical protein
MYALLLGNEIERVSEEKDLGVTIDEELTFEKHAQEKIKKVNSTFAAIRRSFQIFKGGYFSTSLQIHGKIPSGLCTLSLGSIQKGDN